MIRNSMENISEFLKHCDTLTSGQSLEQILIKVINFVSDEEKFSNYFFAADENWRPVKIIDPRAVRWSIEGAVGLASNDFGVVPPAILKFLDGVVHEYTGQEEDVGWFCQNFCHEEVMAFLQVALGKARLLGG